ncbi:MAG: hypothetical protein JWO38_8133 [Gemmataceae bacterium]|nr:hypothetical protein [Gemmataceae bacterium]
MIVPTTAGPEGPARHLLFLSTPALWPCWPFLPVVRRTAGGEDLGLLFDAPGAAGLTGYRATVFRTSLFTRPARLDQFLALPQEVFDTAAEVFAAGWRVD